MIPDPVLDPNWKTYTTGRNGKDASYSFFPSSRNYIRESTAVIETQTILALVVVQFHSHSPERLKKKNIK